MCVSVWGSEDNRVMDEGELVIVCWKKCQVSKGVKCEGACVSVLGRGSVRVCVGGENEVFERDMRVPGGVVALVKVFEGVH